MEPPQEAEPLWPTAVQPDISLSTKECGGRPAGISARTGPGLLRRRGTPLRAPSNPRASLTSVCPGSETRISVPRPSVPPLLGVRSPLQRYPGLPLAPLRRWPDRTSRHDPGSLSLPPADRSCPRGFWAPVPAPGGSAAPSVVTPPGSGLSQSHFLLRGPRRRMRARRTVRGPRPAYRVCNHAPATRCAPASLGTQCPVGMSVDGGVPAGAPQAFSSPFLLTTCLR